MGRPRKPTEPALETSADCERALRDLQAARIEALTFTGKVNRLAAKIQARYEKRIDAAKKLAGSLLKALELYYYGHLADIENHGEKHLDLPNGRIGRRDDPEHLAPLNKAWTWEKIAAAVEGKYGFEYHHPPKPRELD